MGKRKEERISSENQDLGGTYLDMERILGEIWFILRFILLEEKFRGNK